MLSNDGLWRKHELSEENLDIQYRDSESDQQPTAERDEPDNLPLRTRSSRIINPSQLHFTVGDKTTKIIMNKRNISRKSIARKSKQPRPTLAPQWNIIADGTITNYSPHTLTIETPLIKNTVI